MRRTQKVYGIRLAGCKGLIFTTGRYRVSTKNCFILQSIRFETIHLAPCTLCRFAYAAVTRDEGNVALRLPVVRISLYNRPLRAVSLSNGRWAFSDSLLKAIPPVSYTNASQIIFEGPDDGLRRILKNKIPKS
jgi:hypothetical protein